MTSACAPSLGVAAHTAPNAPSNSHTFYLRALRLNQQQLPMHLAGAQQHLQGFTGLHGADYSDQGRENPHGCAACLAWWLVRREDAGVTGAGCLAGIKDSELPCHLQS